MAALQGSLKDQSAADLLMFFANERQTGVLRFYNRKRELHVDWLRGEIINVVEKPEPQSGSLGDLLLHIGEISQGQLEQAIMQQKKTLSPLGVVLQNLFGCEPERIRFVLRVQAIESLYSLFFWDSGTYEFESSSVATPRNSYPPIEVGHLVVEAVPVAEAWATIHKYFPEPLINIRRLMSAIPPSLFEKLDDLPCAIFELLEQDSTFREISILSGAGQFAAGYALVQLLQVELIRIEAPKKKEKIDYNRLLFGGPVTHFFVWLIVSALIVCGGTFLFAFAPYSPLQYFRSPVQFKVADSRWNDQVDTWRRIRIRRALENYRISQGQYPTALHQLVKHGWISENLIHFPGGDVYYYQRLGAERYRLLAPLP